MTQHSKLAYFERKHFCYLQSCILHAQVSTLFHDHCICSKRMLQFKVTGRFIRCFYIQSLRKCGGYIIL